jgi:hypothetical protein
VHLWKEGREIGSMVSRGLRPDGALNVASSTVPHLGDGTFDNDKDSDAVAVNLSLPAMPSKWSALSAGVPETKGVWPLIRRVAPKAAICRDHDESKPRRSRIGDVRIKQIWGSQTGESLLLYGVSDSQNNCDGMPTEQEEVLIHRDANGALRLLPGQFACSATTFYPGQIADFDGDGKDEALIGYEGYNCYGVALYYGGFTNFVRMNVDIKAN